jgi:hypothetical protein
MVAQRDESMKVLKNQVDVLKQLEAVRKDRDNLSAELRQVKEVTVDKLKELENQRERELNAERTKASLLRDENVTLLSKVNSQKVKNFHVKLSCMMPH